MLICIIYLHYDVFNMYGSLTVDTFIGMISDLAVKIKSLFWKRKENCVNDVMNYYNERL